jgi:cyclophilin family peptidyl-prolyl cis-trans isomerase/HEAT repeat protein
MIKIISMLTITCLIFVSSLSGINAKQAQQQTQKNQQASALKPSSSEPIEDSHETSLEAQIYQLADQREYHKSLFNQALKSKELELQKAALISLGRIGGSSTIAAVQPFLKHHNSSLRQLAALAIGLSGDKAASQLLWQLLKSEKIETVKQEIYLGLANLAEDNLINKMLEQAKHEESELALTALFQGLSITLTFNPTITQNYQPDDLTYVLQLIKQNNQASTTAALFLSRVAKIENYFQLADVIELTQIELSALTKSYSMRLIGRLVSRLDNKLSATSAKLSALQKNNVQAQQKALDWAINQSSSIDFTVQVESVRLLAKIMKTKVQALNKLIMLTESNNLLLAQTALKALANSTLTSEKLITLFKAKLSHINNAIQVEAMTGLIKRQSIRQATWIFSFFSSKKTYVKIQLIKLLANQYLDQDGEKSGALHDETLQKAALQIDDAKKIIALFKRDNDQAVSLYAKNTLKPTTKIAETPAHSPSYIAAISASKKRILLETEIGNITIQLNHNAPFTSWHFINNINNGYFNQSYFNRVIANFVAQGGDNIGDGEGSSGKTIREEINLLSHAPMSVGMATLGKDTGSSQFFINTARNFHLDRNYTVFGHVVEGEAVAYKLTHGVKVLAMKVLPQPL